jgi:hypothetical protein
MVLAVQFKQMALYFAIPFGVFALSKLIFQVIPQWKSKEYSQVFIYIAYKIFIYILVFVITNAIILLPWIMEDGLEGI